MAPSSQRRKPFIIAIAGGSASGKSTFARHLAAALAPLSVAIVPEDAYYFSVPGGRSEDGTPFNFDRPETKDFDLLLEHLANVCRDEPFDLPIYDFASHTRQAETIRVESPDVLIVEGMHNLGNAALRALADLTIFVEANETVREARRVTRDVAERGREIEATRAQFAAIVAPMHDLHVETLRDHAKILIANAGMAPEALKSAADELAMNIRSNLTAGS